MVQSSAVRCRCRGGAAWVVQSAVSSQQSGAGAHHAQVNRCRGGQEVVLLWCRGRWCSCRCRCRCSAAVQVVYLLVCTCAQVRKCRNAEVQVQRCASAGMQRWCRGDASEVVQR